MTIISVVLGRTFHYVDDVLPFRFFNLFSFGIIMHLKYVETPSTKKADCKKLFPTIHRRRILSNIPTSRPFHFLDLTFQKIEEPNMLYSLL